MTWNQPHKKLGINSDAPEGLAVVVLAMTTVDFIFIWRPTKLIHSLNV
jgi:hypothetical protein